MDSCKRHLKEFYKAIGQELNKVIDEPEEETLDEIIARHSDEEGHSTGGESAGSNTKAKGGNIRTGGYSMKCLK